MTLQNFNLPHGYGGPRSSALPSFSGDTGHGEEGGGKEAGGEGETVQGITGRGRKEKGRAREGGEESDCIGHGGRSVCVCVCVSSALSPQGQ